MRRIVRLIDFNNLYLNYFNRLHSLLRKDNSTRISWEEFFLHPFLGFEGTSASLPGSSPLQLSPNAPFLELRGRSVSTPVMINHE